MGAGWGRVVLVGAWFAGSATPPAAQESATTASASGWAFTVAPYFLAPYMDGQLGIGNGPPATIAASPGDIFDRLQFGAMLYLEARKGPWGGFVDGLYMDLEQTAQRENLAATASAVQGAVEISAFRAVTQSVDVLVGARINVLDGDLALSTPDILLAQSEVWVDPLVGVRLWAPLPAPWRLGIMADVGGFSIGSTLAYQIYPMAGARVSQAARPQARPGVPAAGDGAGEGRHRRDTDWPQARESLRQAAV